jgi:AcrR family transcriptional regulator
MARPRITEERRRQILEAAAAVMAERGVCEARISDVAARIGMSPALILYYFPSKDALLADALAYRDQQFFESVAQGVEEGADAAASRLRRLIEASCPPSEFVERTDSEWLLWLDVWTRSRHDPELSAERARLDGLFRAQIADIVRDGIKSGQFEKIDPDRFAVMLSALIDGLAIQVLLQDPSVDSATMQDLCLDIAASYLGPAVKGKAGAASGKPSR